LPNESIQQKDPSANIRVGSSLPDLSPEVPVFGIFLGGVLALGECQVQRELSPSFFSDPAPIPVFAVPNETLGELFPLPRAIAHPRMTLAVPINLTLK